MALRVFALQKRVGGEEDHAVHCKGTSLFIKGCMPYNLVEMYVDIE